MIFTNVILVSYYTTPKISSPCLYVPHCLARLVGFKIFIIFWYIRSNKQMIFIYTGYISIRSCVCSDVLLRRMPVQGKAINQFKPMVAGALQPGSSFINSVRSGFILVVSENRVFAQYPTLSCRIDVQILSISTLCVNKAFLIAIILMH